MPRRDADWPTASAYLPPSPDLDALREAAAGCRGCPLWEPATQTVFGRGGTSARLVLVGEQPGDVEDQKGVPFVGPAGRELVAALDEAEVDRSDVYVTNVFLLTSTDSVSCLTSENTRSTVTHTWADSRKCARGKRGKSAFRGGPPAACAAA